MKRSWLQSCWASLAVLCLVLATGRAFGEGAASAAQAGEDRGPARKIVVFETGVVNAAAQDKILRNTGAVKLKSLPIVNAAVVLAAPANEKALRGAAGILRIEDDAIATASPKPERPPKDQNPPPGESLPWGVDRVDADLIWDRDADRALDAGANAGAGVKVAVVDTGIDLTHPDLKANIIGGYNAIKPSASASDDNGHGTHVAGIIAALDNNEGVIGVAPKASLLAVKVLDRRGSGYVSDIIEGIQWSMANGAQVINMSLGTSVDVQSFHDAVAQAYSQGIVIVAAAGNSGPDDYTVEYPGKYPEVIAVSATDTANKIANFSSRGPEVELAAPGVNIPSTYKGGTYKTISGTSMASPHVAGAVALLMAAGVTDPETVRATLRQSADDTGLAGFDVQYGYGLLDAEEAVTGIETN